MDNTLFLERAEEQPGLKELARYLADRAEFVFVVATGRAFSVARTMLQGHGIPMPDYVIASVGTMICDGVTGERDRAWESHVAIGWNPKDLHTLAVSVPGLQLQEPEHQSPLKVSYYIDDPSSFDLSAVGAALQRLGAVANIFVTQGRFLDLLPPRASKGLAVRHLGAKLSIPMSRTLACGDAGNDRDMLEISSRAIVVANHSAELAYLQGRTGVFFSSQTAAAGVLEGILFHGFPFSDECDGGS